MVTSRGPVLRPAVPDDVPSLHRFVVALAAGERPPEEVVAEPGDLAEALFGERPVAEAVVAELDGRPVGFAVHYPTYSTILGRRGIHLEDLYVEPSARGRGIGRLLLEHLAGLAAQRGCGRLEWWVMRINSDAIRFYQHLRARGLDEVEVMRLDGDALRDLGRPAVEDVAS